MTPSERTDNPALTEFTVVDQKRRWSTVRMDAATEAISEGRKARNDRNLSAARENYARAAEIYRARNEVLAYAHTIRHVADICQQEDNFSQAKKLYEEALEIYRSNLNTKVLDLANTVRPYALLNESEGDLELARDLWEEARQLYSSLRLEVGVSECNDHIYRLKKGAGTATI